MTGQVYVSCEFLSLISWNISMSNRNYVWGKNIENMRKPIRVGLKYANVFTTARLSDKK